MPRLEGRTRRLGPLARVGFWYSRRKVGKVATPAAVAAHNPWILRAMGGYELALDRARKVDVKLKMLAEMKASVIVGCPW
jgi:hypothetical protein